MTEAWREAVKLAIAKDVDQALSPVARVGLPMPARDPFDDEEKRARGNGGVFLPRAGRLMVEGKNVFVVRGVDDEAGNGRIHLYDPAGHLIERGAVKDQQVAWE